MPNTWCFEWSQRTHIQGQAVQPGFWDFLNLTMEQPHSFEILQTTNPATQHNTPEDKSSAKLLWDLKSHNTISLQPLTSRKPGGTTELAGIT